MPVSLTSSMPASPPTSLTTTWTTAVPIFGDRTEVEPNFDPEDIVVVGDRLWISRRDALDLPVLASCDDGWNWTAIDPVDFGLPIDDQGEFGLGTEGVIGVLGSVDRKLHVLYGVPPIPGVSADGANVDLYVLTTEGADEGELRLMGSEVTGLDQRLDAPDLVGSGRTGGGDRFRLRALSPGVRTTSDGVEWTPISPLPDDAGRAEAIAASSDRVIVVALVPLDPDDGTIVRAVVWWSEDGLAWHSVPLPGPEGEIDVVSAVWTRDRFLVLGAMSSAMSIDRWIWESDEGLGVARPRGDALLRIDLLLPAPRAMTSAGLDEGRDARVGGHARRGDLRDDP